MAQVSLYHRSSTQQAKLKYLLSVRFQGGKQSADVGIGAWQGVGTVEWVIAGKQSHPPAGAVFSTATRFSTALLD